MSADISGSTATPREDLNDWLLPRIAVGVLAIVGLSLAAALLVFVIGNYHNITGMAFTVLSWAVSALAWILFAAAVVVLARAIGALARKVDQHIRENSSVVPGVLAGLAAAFLGFANDLTAEGMQRLFVTGFLGVIAFFAVELFRQNKLLGVAVLLLIPLSLVLLFFLMPDEKQQKWLDEQGSGGVVYGVLTGMVIVLALVMAWFFDRRKRATAGSTDA